jgi:hypothetical protein
MALLEFSAEKIGSVTMISKRLVSFVLEAFSTHSVTAQYTLVGH